MSELIIANKSDITNIADAVRSKTGGTSLLSLNDMADEINGLSIGGEVVSVQADWNQNDEAASDYIKNRTHWIENSYAIALPETELDVRNGSVDLYEVEVSGLTPNAHCVVTIDGVSYETTAVHGVFNAYEWYIIGNGELIGEGDNGSDLPFGIFVDKYNENYMTLADSSKTGTIILKIEVVGEQVHKIPEIYLPEKIGISGSGTYSEAFNDLSNNKASGDYSHSENFKTTASGYASHAEGLSTIASGYGAHTEGANTIAKGAYSNASGYYTEANGVQSHAEGEGTIANGRNQHVFGSYNIEDSSSLIIVGNGASSNNKSNAYKLTSNGDGYFSRDVYSNNKKLATEEYTEALYKKLNSNTVLGFYCIEDVTIVLNGVSTVYPANSNVEIKFIETDVFEIIPTSDNSILALNAFPGALGTYYSWLEGVKQFSNILFDMNSEDMYTKWSQGNQGAYRVQFAQYLNCIFWSDNPYVSEVTKRTNYTLYYTSQLPLCYSNIPDNTFKAFYLAFNVTSDPNWGNKAYRDSFAKATWATQAFSYYGARTIGIFGHDSSDFNIVLPKDCRGLMSAATAIENAGTFDAINTTNFGASSGSWRDAFGWCSSLRNLYIKNLKVNLNVSWSPLNYDSIYYIISEATNTNKITITVSPYTYNLLSPSDFELAASKDITIELLTTNYVEDRRLSDIANKADKTEVLVKTEQELTDEELTQVRQNLKFIGKNLGGKTVTIDGTKYTASNTAEIFGDYENNIAVGDWSIAEGSGTIAKGRACHVEGAYGKALQDGTHVEGYGCEASGYWSHAEGEMTIVSSYASHAEGSYCTMPDGTKRYSTAAGYASHTEGGGCHTTGTAAHAEGIGTTANGRCSHVEGTYTIASGKAQHVEGIANVEDTSDKYIHIAGNGTSPTDRSNAYTLDWNGNGWFAGNVEATAIILKSSTEGSTKTFKLTINDSGELSISENI